MLDVPKLNYSEVCKAVNCKLWWPVFLYSEKCRVHQWCSSTKQQKPEHILLWLDLSRVFGYLRVVGKRWCLPGKGKRLYKSAYLFQ